MERNDGIDGGTPAGQNDANEFSGSAATSQPAGGTTGAGGTSGSEAGFDFAGTAASSEKQGIRDRAKNVLGTAGGKLADVGSTVRDKAGSAKDKLANALESGAERLRERSQTGAGGTLAGVTPEGTTPLQADSKVAQVSDKVAGGMDATADWLREADLDNLKVSLERQVQEHPGRTLLIAAGLGYLIGRAFRSNQ
jgi:ElaB/YqjD/DUF883 family membrane-anchored ribosome-binding protein